MSPANGEKKPPKGLPKVHRLVWALTGVCAAGAIVLAGTDRLTEGPIAEERRLEVVRALDAVLPAHSNHPDQDTETVVADDGLTYTLYRARDGTRWVATALKVTAPDGYAGPIDLMVGVNRAGVLTGIAVLAHRETPGLGDWIVKDAAWRDRFRGRTLDNTRWAVRKDGGDIDQFTGATITPRAVTGAVRRALEVCRAFCR